MYDLRLALSGENIFKVRYHEKWGKNNVFKEKFKNYKFWLVNSEAKFYPIMILENLLTKLFFMLSSSSALFTVQQLLIGIISVGAE